MLQPPGFYFVKKPKRFVILSSDKSSERNLSSFFDIKKPRRLEHLQSEEPFSSDPYFSNRKKMQSCPTCIMKHFKAYLNFIFIRLPIVFYIFSCLRKNFFAFDFVLTDILRQILRTLEKFRQNANGMWKEDSRKFLRKRKLTTHKKKVVDDVEKFCRIITACI